MSWLQGTIVENRHWTETLFSLRVQGAPLAFQAGQFVRIALDTEAGNEGSRIARPFSFVNPPDDPVLEFYGVIVPEGPLSPRLAKLSPGDRLYVASNPAGFLVLREVPDCHTLWLIATGTGIAPYLSILRTETPWRRFRSIVLVHAARYGKELVYQDIVSDLSKRNLFRYVSFVSRERHAGSLEGRIPAAIADGRLEKAAGLALDPASSHVMLCGNPQMLKEAQAALMARGMRKHRRRNPGHITVESFW
ncbi:MAG TPA: ferredoxin--NADP reductase [Burkholderiales bacterium]|nr:ferredoxin--NADP reductase [Burkholderiales bacterium]